MWHFTIKTMLYGLEVSFTATVRERTSRVKGCAAAAICTIVLENFINTITGVNTTSELRLAQT